ncbi:hypothetical protein CPB85DRAFT_1429999 [Mucidula mucida]|nr:hypothetical protein CPB85DRAFT_1429999 [Mucidula mucida]
MTGGFASFFYQNGNPGACGETHKDSDLIALLRFGFSQGSTLCGKYAVITNTNNGK